MLYRVDREFDEYKCGEWETKKYYQYVCGLRNVGKACLNADYNNRVVRIEHLCFSIKGLIVCLKKTCSSQYNQTSKKNKKNEKKCLTKIRIKCYN